MKNRTYSVSNNTFNVRFTKEVEVNVSLPRYFKTSNEIFYMFVSDKLLLVVKNYKSDLLRHFDMHPSIEFAEAKDRVGSILSYVEISENDFKEAYLEVSMYIQNKINHG
jgi:hypothetical protein